MSHFLETDCPHPFFVDLWRVHHFRVDLMASQADVPEETVLTMLRYQPVERGAAEQVLAALSSVYQQRYTLETVRVKLREGDACHG